MKKFVKIIINTFTVSENEAKELTGLPLRILVRGWGIKFFHGRCLRSQLNRAMAKHFGLTISEVL